jgi:hypothetical protein
MAQAIHGLVNGFVYQPYETGNALISPAVEIGDAVTIDGKLCGIYQMNITFGAMLGVKLAAPSDGDVIHEYHYTSPIEKVKKQLATATAELKVLDDSIQGIVKDVEGNLSEFEATAEELTARVESAEGAATEAQQTAEGFSQRITDAEGNISSIEHTLNGVVYTTANGTTEIDGSHITTGTIDASKADIKNLSVEKLTVAGKNIGGASSALNAIYSASGTITTLTSHGLTLDVNSADEGVAVLVTATGVKVGSNAIVSWQDIIAGGTGTAVFG